MDCSELLLDAADAKLQLIERIKQQMVPYIEKGTISPRTVNLIKLARECFIACKMKVTSEPQNAIYLFGRGCWNLGEGVCLGRLERGTLKKT